MSDGIVMLIILRIKCRFPDYSLAPNANRSHYRYTNKENDMDKKLIQQLLDDDDTRLEIAIAIGVAVDLNDDGSLYDDLMINALNELNDIPVKGEMITIEVSDHMLWVRGAYIRTESGGKIAVSVPGVPGHYTGKRVELVIKGEEGEADV
jgi:hypothetical protein